MRLSPRSIDHQASVVASLSSRPNELNIATQRMAVHIAGELVDASMAVGLNAGMVLNLRCRGNYPALGLTT